MGTIVRNRLMFTPMPYPGNGSVIVNVGDWVTLVAASGLPFSAGNHCVQILGVAMGTCDPASPDAARSGTLEVQEAYPGVQFEIPIKAGTNFIASMLMKSFALDLTAGVYSIDLGTTTTPALKLRSVNSRLDGAQYAVVEVLSSASQALIDPS